MIYRMLQHLYMQAYTVDFGFDAFWSVNDSWATTRLHVHAQMYGLGDKYHLPALKKEALRRFDQDVRIPTDSKSETLRLLLVVPTIYSTTPETDRQLRNLVVRQVFQRHHIASKYFVEELDTALEVRQFARDLIVLHSKRPTVDNSALTQAYVIWHRCVRTLLAVVTPFQTAAGFIHRGVMRLFTSSVVCFFAFVIAYSFPFLFYCYCKAKIRQLEHWQRLEQWAIRHG